MKSTRIHSSSSFSLNSGSWLEEVLTSPTNILFSLWNIVKARLRLWLDVFIAEISKTCLLSAWWHWQGIKVHKLLIQLRREARRVIIPKIKQKKKVISNQHVYVYVVLKYTHISPPLEKSTCLSLQLWLLPSFKHKICNISFLQTLWIEYSNATCKYLKMCNRRGWFFFTSVLS